MQTQPKSKGGKKKKKKIPQVKYIFRFFFFFPLSNFNIAFIMNEIIDFLPWSL